MPLPDERPRQSVQNLIGRFEQKRPSLSGITPPLLPRSTSVASHITGDSVKEEIREKREWPPRSTLQDEKPKITLPSAFLRPSTSQPIPPPQVSEAPATPAKPVPEDPGPPPAPAPEPVKTPKSSTASARSPPVRKPTSTPIKSPTPKASGTAMKPPVRSPPRASILNTSNSQPLRPQHTGTSTKSVTSPPSTVRHIKTNSKSAQSTPNRPKTPAANHASRPKTPGSTLTAGTSRPKTPSGLFAPTAASLAKARNAAAPAVPTPIKKATLSTSAAERLSKPTAASISKVRTPSLPGTSPSRGGKVAARGTSKPRMGLARARAKEMAAKKNGNGVKIAEAAAEAAGEQEVEQLSDEGIENGHDLDASGFLTEPETGSFADQSVELLVTESEDVSHEPVDEVTTPEESKAEIEGTEPSSTPSPQISSSPILAPEDPSDELEAEPETGVVHLDDTPNGPHSDEPEILQPASAEDPVEEAKPHVQAGNDIHDIVNLLETVPISKVRLPSIPDDAPDIPDEE